MKKLITTFISVLILGSLLAGCGQGDLPETDGGSAEPTQNETTENVKYIDGIYRGFYRIGQEEEIAVQFELLEEKFTEVSFRTIRYKGENYLSDGATDIQRQIVKQYRQAANYLIGEEVDALGHLRDSKEIVGDMDAVTSATLNLNKFVLAMEDGLSRNVFKPVGSNPIILEDSYADGMYKGAYQDGGVEQIAVKVKIENNHFVSVEYSELNYGDQDYLKEGATDTVRAIKNQYQQAADYLEGKKVSALAKLYDPKGIVTDQDAVTGPTLRTNKLISAICNALSAGPKNKE